MSFLKFIQSIDFNDKYAKPVEFNNKKVSYGTAGFRTKAVELDWVMYRMGLLACLRSISLDCKYIGCMITASHNPAEDNGCKLVDPLGDMLEEKWEDYATQLVNSNDLKSTMIKLCSEDLKSYIEKYEEILSKDGSKKPNITVAHDTRQSCPLLLDAFKTGTEKLNGNLLNYGLLTTPQLHYMVRCLNTDGEYGEPNEDGYYNKVVKAFTNVWSLIDFKTTNNYDTELYVDGANGIGANKIKLLSSLLSSVSNDGIYLNDKKNCTTNGNGHHNGSNGSSERHININHRKPEKTLNIHLFNKAEKLNDELNHLCGADHVKVQQKPPLNLPIVSDKSSIRKYCSFDGDADRIVYYYIDKNDRFNLLDGDKISLLVATHLKELVQEAELGDQISLCIVQTAYANGSSTDFIKNKMKVNVSCVPTGVKHLHHEAQKFDIGVYFEANGHGTILFSEKAEKLIEEKYTSLIKKSEYLDESIELFKWIKATKNISALYNLKNFKDCINQTVGDAISDMLVVELILAMRNLSVEDWNLLYTDLPSRQLKVKIKDRNQIKTTDAERRVSQPIELQDKIDELIKSTNSKHSRSFVRPSGTEDVVRVYAEADTQENADVLAKKVSQLVFDIVGGVGDRP